MINQITGGTVEFTRPSSYSTDKSGAKVSLSFSCEDGATDAVAQAMLDMVAAMAMAKAREMTGDIIKAIPVSSQTEPVPPVIPVPSAALIALPTAEPAQAPALPPERDVITDKRLVEEVTAKNARLLNAAPDDMVRQQVPQRLHALVASFVPPPAKVQAIPAEQRAAFLEQLAAL